MLAVTDNAVAVIRDLTGQQNLPDGAGVRIARTRRRARSR